MCRKEILNDIKMQLAFLSGNMDRVNSEIKELEEILKGFPMKLSCWLPKIEIDSGYCIRIGFDSFNNKWGILVAHYEKSPTIGDIIKQFLLNSPLELRIIAAKYLDDLLLCYQKNIETYIILLNSEKGKTS